MSTTIQSVDQSGSTQGSPDDDSATTPPAAAAPPAPAEDPAPPSIEELSAQGQAAQAAADAAAEEPTGPQVDLIMISGLSGGRAGCVIDLALLGEGEEAFNLAHAHQTQLVVAVDEPALRTTLVSALVSEFGLSQDDAQAKVDAVIPPPPMPEEPPAPPTDGGVGTEPEAAGAAAGDPMGAAGSGSDVGAAEPAPAPEA